MSGSVPKTPARRAAISGDTGTLHSRFDQFRKSPLGIQLESFFKTPTR